MKLFVIVIIGLHCIAAQDITCSKEFCEEYLSKNKCPKLPENCQIQNATHNGLVLPFTGPCNCCEYCLESLDEGDTCSVGTQTSLVPTNICGDSLACKSETKTCGRMESKCTKAQDKYDQDRENGNLGHLQIRPNCDKNGEFLPYVCVTGEICYCVDDDGNRLFGEIPISPIVEMIMKCKCSRAHNLISNILGKELLRPEHFRCDADGSYDPIQCIDEQCFCVDKVDGKPTHSDWNLVNISSINNKTLPCFDHAIHLEYDYYRECESKIIRKQIEVSDVKNEGYDVYATVYPKCGLDGYYNMVQYDGIDKYCVDKGGKILDNYKVSMEDGVNMNCKCARARQLIDEIEKPVCDQMGNYEQIQCRRGLCRCVDENGIQTKKEVDENDKDKLDCNEGILDAWRKI